MVGNIVSFIIGAVIGILGCYSWQKGFIKDAGIK